MSCINCVVLLCFGLNISCTHMYMYIHVGAYEVQLICRDHPVISLYLGGSTLILVCVAIKMCLIFVVIVNCINLHVYMYVCYV